ncbi:MAG: BREX-1 system adenine-specific DNA-methyltransferase PglX [Gammaproteobacteria bacterium]|jgi:hypothetical protein|nr:BREX-1 system adenine-specific DNA-methyltransferase PglX [Gammaproteobacteria bacterium]
MQTTKLKTYAPKARRDFIAAVTRRAASFGLSAKGISTVREEGEVVVIEGQAYPMRVGAQRARLAERIRRQGFEQVMEAAAYTWFNRFAAIRFMELHGYLDHSFRVLSHPAGGALPEILEQAQHVELPGLDRQRIIAQKMDGTQDEVLYRDLLLAQCRALHRAMPFLFERVDDETELLLPDSLLQTDSIIRELVTAIPEEDWQAIEIIGWLYQFYISEKKDQVIGKVVKSEDIPAATQLFTPNWIVQYLVQNSVGRLWLMANPTSTLASEWPYYIQPAEQTPEVQTQLDALIQTRIREDGDALNPESITMLDPACGSGHILVVAYDVLKAIYLERGYRLRDIPRLILEKNLYGLDIDDRAAQMAGFALLMKARADDRRLLNYPENPPKLNVLSLQESKGLSIEELSTHLAPFGVQRATIGGLIEAFENAKTFGSLIQIPYHLKTHMAPLARMVALVEQADDLYARQAAQDLLPLVRQAQLLAMQFDAVVANPPYMGGKGMNPALKDYAKATFSDRKSDLFAMFIERGFKWCKPSGFNSMVTMQSWMFLSSYEAMRENLLRQRTLSCMVHMGNGVMGIAFGTAATVMLSTHVSDYAGSFSYCKDSDIGADEKPKQFPVENERLKNAKPDDFKNIPGSPVAYWVGKNLLRKFTELPPLESVCPPKKGLVTSDNRRFLKLWHEVSFKKVELNATTRLAARASGRKWFPINCGGAYRRWFGNADTVINWELDGDEIIEYAAKLYGSASRQIQNTDYYFRESVTWSNITSGAFGARYSDHGFIFGAAGTSAFAERSDQLFATVAYLNSKVATYILKVFNPTLNFVVNDIASLPFDDAEVGSIPVLAAKECIQLARDDWNSFETSWVFERVSFCEGRHSTLSYSWSSWAIKADDRIKKVRSLEENNNRIFINAYGLQDELSPEVPEDQITLTRADREKDCQRLISYAIGCMMGRYSLDEPGLIYAHAGNVGFDPSRYARFPADADGILPITDEHWFEDDVSARVSEFLQAVWGPDTLAENLAWLAESLGTKGGETPEETIRRYIADKFYKDHLQTYKKRPIYWCFSSGRQKAFQCLVYLHRYHAGTLARMRMEYVVPLQSKMAARIDSLTDDIQAASSSAQAKRLQKERDTLTKQLDELRRFDEQLRHYADQRITLDLDDGVKVNYGKFGDLLAEVKAVTGTSAD